MSQIEQLKLALDTIAKVIENYVYPIENGCVENHIYESHARGKNWIATVTPNRAAPGGLDRVFWKFGSKAWYKAPEIKPGDVLEFGGDYYTGSGRKKADRCYTLVLRVEADYFVGVRIASTAPSAKKVAEEKALYGLTVTDKTSKFADACGSRYCHKHSANALADEPCPLDIT